MSENPSQDFENEITSRTKGIEAQVKLLNTNAGYWGNRNKTGLALIELYTLAATIIMATNIALRENIQALGGWIPFCIASAVLTACAAYIVNGQKSETPSVNRLKSLEALMHFRALLRTLQSTREWTEAKLHEFDERIAKTESDYALFLVSPPRLGFQFYFVLLFVLIVGVYLSYEFVQVAGDDLKNILRLAKPTEG